GFTTYRLGSQVLDSTAIAPDDRHRGSDAHRHGPLWSRTGPIAPSDSSAAVPYDALRSHHRFGCRPPQAHGEGRFEPDGPAEVRQRGRQGQWRAQAAMSRALSQPRGYSVTNVEGLLQARHLRVARTQRLQMIAVLDQLEDRGRVVGRVVDAGLVEFL